MLGIFNSFKQAQDQRLIETKITLQSYFSRFAPSWKTEEYLFNQWLYSLENYADKLKNIKEGQSVDFQTMNHGHIKLVRIDGKLRVKKLWNLKDPE